MMRGTKKAKTQKHSPIRVIRNVWYMFRYTFRYAPGYIGVCLVEAFGRGFWHILSVLYTKYLLDAVERGIDFERILTVTLLTGGYSVVFEFFNKWMLCVYRPKANLALHEGIQNELYQKARQLDQSCYDDPEFYNDFIWAIRESDSRLAAMLNDLGLFLNRIISSVVIWGVLASMDVIVAIALLVLVALGFFIKLKMNKVRYEQSQELNPINRKLEYVGRIFYLTDYAKELRQGGIGRCFQEKYLETTEEKIGCIRKYARKIVGVSLLASLLTNILPHTGVTCYLIVRYILDPTLSLGGFSASMNATFKLYWTISDIGNFLTKYNEHSLYVERVRRFIDYEPTIRGTVSEVPGFESLVVRGLSFTYPFSKDQSPQAATLKNMDLEIRKGEKIAFVGYNGAGKTTLTKLFMRLYDPSRGEILYNGQDIRQFDPRAYRQHIGAVFQDYKVFAASIAENVLGGEYTPEDEERVMHALKAASFEDKLFTLPEGIQSPLTREFHQNGIGLSGGEAQKIAIARVFAQPYELIIMDEPSSALDPIAEYNLNQSILQNAADKTVIFISHRLSTTRMADRIYMFDHGEIIEWGTHGELMEQNGKYAQMYRVQAKKYKL